MTNSPTNLENAERAEMEPKVKPLEWQEIHYNRSNEEPIPELTGWYAETEVGSYYVMLEGRIEVTLDGFQFHKVGSFDEPEAAFDAAQSDFASRIRSCLLDKPEAVEGETLKFVREAVLGLLPANAGGDELKVQIIRRIDAAMEGTTNEVPADRNTGMDDLRSGRLWDGVSNVGHGRLISQIDALLDLDTRKALAPHGLGGLARELLQRSRAALTQEPTHE